MIIKSKYDIKDRIYWLDSNKVRSAVVKSIQFPLVQWMKGEPLLRGECMYFVSDRVNSSVINWNGGGLREGEIFLTKKELLKSL